MIEAKNALTVGLRVYWDSKSAETLPPKQLKKCNFFSNGRYTYGCIKLRKINKNDKMPCQNGSRRSSLLTQHGERKPQLE